MTNHSKSKMTATILLFWAGLVLGAAVLVMGDIFIW